MRIALVSRELYPLRAGGIGQYVSALATVLSSIAEVTVLTLAPFEPEYERLRAAGDPRLPPSSVRAAFVAEPSKEEASGYYHVMHCYSARTYERLQELYPDGGPDVIEFPDFLGEAFVTVQAAAALDPFLAATRVCVRAHTTAEMCDVLDGHLDRRLSIEALRAMERYSLRHADALLWQGGDILATYRRFYGAQALAQPVHIRSPYTGPAQPGVETEYVASEPLRLLYVGRLERRKGVHNLVHAVTGMARDDFHLTLLGGDTNTAPLGASMRDALELEIAGDPRIELADPLDADGVAAAISAHDAVVIPSLWECWPYVALEALHLNRPVLGTPVGGLVEMVEPGRSGWLAAGTDAIALEAALTSVLSDAGSVAELIRAGAPAQTGRSLADEGQIAEAYARLASSQPRRPPARPVGRPPLVSAVIPYYRSARWVRETVDSLLEQTYSPIEIVLVNDGSFEDEDWVVAELAARQGVTVVSTTNSGLGAARNFGIAQTRGRYVLPLDSDNTIEPGFVARAVEILERRSEVAYVTSWSLYVDDGGEPLSGLDVGYEPLGNEAAGLVAVENVAGDAVALIRRRLFDTGFRYSEELTSYEDWHFYRELGSAGHFGVVIPERLFRYRVRADSMQSQIAQPNRERLVGEIDARIRENAIRWTSSNA
jgi:glycogen(starch) synthase